MCKVAIIPAIKQSKIDQTLKLVVELGKKMSFGNNDGLGYAAIDAEGNLFGERWWMNSSAFNTLQDTPKLVEKFGKFAKTSYSLSNHVYNSFGDVNLRAAKAITLHTRMATSGKEFKNTHPFVESDTSLIHNGIISNTEDFEFTLSTCDSEAILKAYLSESVGLNIENTSKMTSKLYGYYVAALFSRDGQGNRVLDIIKGNNDALICAWVNEIETYVFCSSMTTLKEACSILGFTLGSDTDFLDGIAMRLNPFTGDLISGTTFDPNNRSKPVKYTEPSFDSYYGAGSMDRSRQPIPISMGYNHKTKKNRNLSKDEISYYQLPIKTVKVNSKWLEDDSLYYQGGD